MKQSFCLKSKSKDETLKSYQRKPRPILTGNYFVKYVGKYVGHRENIGLDKTFIRYVNELYKSGP